MEQGKSERVRDKADLFAGGEIHLIFFTSIIDKCLAVRANNFVELKELSSSKDSASTNAERFSAEISTVSNSETCLPFVYYLK